MNLLPLITAAENLDMAACCTNEPAERAEIVYLLDLLHSVLQRHGVYRTPQFSRPRPGAKTTPPDDAAPGSTEAQKCPKKKPGSPN